MTSEIKATKSVCWIPLDQVFLCSFVLAPLLFCLYFHLQFFLNNFFTQCKKRQSLPSEHGIQEGDCRNVDCLQHKCSRMRKAFVFSIPQSEQAGLCVKRRECSSLFDAKMALHQRARLSVCVSSSPNGQHKCVLFFPHRHVHTYASYLLST